MADNPRIEELRRRVQLDPASIAFAALAEEFRRMGRHEDAIETCRSGLLRHPAYLSARVTLGRALIETGDYDAAREELRTVLHSAPENLAAIRGLAEIEERLGRSTEMDPHLAAMMNAEVERIALAAPPPPPVAAPAIDVPLDPPAPVASDPIPAAAPEILIDAVALESALAVHAPSAFAATSSEELIEAFAFAAASAPALEMEPALEETETIDESGPDPVMIATLARLERFLVAIDAARHP